jgi:hypothetical protein
LARAIQPQASEQIHKLLNRKPLSKTPTPQPRASKQIHQLLIFSIKAP